MMEKIDIHLHVGREDWKHGNFRTSSGASMISHLKELGISHGILMSSGEGSGEFTVGNNEDNREVCQRFPQVYHWMCNVDEKNPETVYERLSLYKSQGAVGVGEMMINRWIDNPFLQSVFQAAAQLKMPVLIHLSPEEGYNYGVADRPGLPLLEELLKKQENLKVIGHSQPFWHEISKDASNNREKRNSWGKGPVVPGGRLETLFETYPNLYGDLSANSGGCAIMRDLEYGLWFLERFSSRLMFGTDMANVEMVFPLGKWLDKQHEAGKLSDSAYQKICYENAAELFGIFTG